MVWSRMADSAGRILEKLIQHGFTALRCVADGEIVISVYLVSSEQHIREAALSASRHYPAQRLEVSGVRSSVTGAITQHIVTFTARISPPAPLEHAAAYL